MRSMSTIVYSLCCEVASFFSAPGIKNITILGHQNILNIEVMEHVYLNSIVIL